MKKNQLIEDFFFGRLRYYLSDADKAEYRRPFLQPGESRRPTLAWSRELPRGGNPPDTTQLVTSYSDWFATSQLPKLFIRATPGALLREGPLLNYVRGFDNQQEVTVFGSHYVQETSPHAIGRAIAEWLSSGNV